MYKHYSTEQKGEEKEASKSSGASKRPLTEPPESKEERIKKKPREKKPFIMPIDSLQLCAADGVKVYIYPDAQADRICLTSRIIAILTPIQSKSRATIFKRFCRKTKGVYVQFKMRAYSPDSQSDNNQNSFATNDIETFLTSLVKYCQRECKAHYTGSKIYDVEQRKARAIQLYFALKEWVVKNKSAEVAKNILGQHYDRNLMVKTMALPRVEHYKSLPLVPLHSTPTPAKKSKSPEKSKTSGKKTTELSDSSDPASGSTSPLEFLAGVATAASTTSTVMPAVPSAAKNLSSYAQAVERLAGSGTTTASSTAQPARAHSTTSHSVSSDPSAVYHEYYYFNSKLARTEEELEELKSELDLYEDNIDFTATTLAKGYQCGQAIWSTEKSPLAFCFNEMKKVTQEALDNFCQHLADLPKESLEYKQLAEVEIAIASRDITAVLPAKNDQLLQPNAKFSKGIQLVALLVQYYRLVDKLEQRSRTLQADLEKVKKKGLRMSLVFPFFESSKIAGDDSTSSCDFTAVSSHSFGKTAF